MRIYRVPENYRNLTFLWLKLNYCIDTGIPLEYSTLSLNIGLIHYIIEHKGTLIGYLSFKELPESNAFYLMESYLLPSKRYYLNRVIARYSKIAKKLGYTSIVAMPTKNTMTLYKKHKIGKEI